MDTIDNKKEKAFINEIIEVSKKHGLSLGHEDMQGNFQVTRYDDRKIKWLKQFEIVSNSDFGVY